MALSKKQKQKLLQRAEQSLNTLRPFLQEDGGDVQVVDLTDNMTLRIRFLGSCGNCPMSNATMTAGIEDTVRNSVPEIVRVQAV